MPTNKNPAEKTDLELKTEVIAELDSEPKVRATDIGVLVKEGTVTLNGVVETYDEKWSAMESARRVEGVREIADDIKIIPPDSDQFTDGDIAAAAAKEIEGLGFLTKESVTLMVSKGWITLEGEVEWLQHRKSAEECLLKLTGVRGVSNLISIKETLPSAELAAAILSAFQSNSQLRNQTIEIVTLGSKVILQGQVENSALKNEAERIARSFPGIFSVENELRIG
jgi:osmotically-inducible protein OsmY